MLKIFAAEIFLFIIVDKSELIWLNNELINLA